MLPYLESYYKLVIDHHNRHCLVQKCHLNKSFCSYADLLFVLRFDKHDVSLEIYFAILIRQNRFLTPAKKLMSYIVCRPVRQQ